MKTYHINTYVKPDGSIPIWIDQIKDQDRIEKPHQHDYMEIMYIRKGAGRCSINENSYPLLRGDVFFFFPGDVHAFYPAGLLTYDTIFFLMDAFTEEEKRIIEVQPIFAQWKSSGMQGGQKINLSLSQTAKMEDLNDELAQECHKWNPESNLLRKAVFLRLLFFILRGGISAVSINNRHDLQLSRLFNYIAKHYAENLSVAELAKTIEVSPNYLNELLQKTIGQSVTEYLLRYRVEQAKIALDDPDNTISWVACCCGFFDASHFIRIFKRYTGMTPGNYRKLKDI